MKIDEILERMGELRNRKLYEQNQDIDKLEWWLSENVKEVLMSSNLNTLKEDKLKEFWGIKVSDNSWIPDDWINLMPIVEVE